MTHWFDRLSRRGLSPEAGITRRDAIARAGAAGLLMPILGAGTASASAAPARLRGRHVFAADACQSCIQDARDQNLDSYRNRLPKLFNRPSVVLLDPVDVSYFCYLIAVAEITYSRRLASCAESVCNPTAMKPQPGAPPTNNPANGNCAEGTHACAGCDHCCYGDDFCCATPSGCTCCVASVGCACAG